MVIKLLKQTWTRVWCAVWLWFRPVVKWVFRRTTKLCELERICYGTVPGAERSRGVEFSLENSRHPEIQKCCTYLDGKCADHQLKSDVAHYALHVITRVKSIKHGLHPRFSGQLLSCIGSIWGYRHLLYEVEALRSVKCTSAADISSFSETMQHKTQIVSEKLHQLWMALKPESPLKGLITKQWQEVGFQGDDPCTDFRGMGLLGLENLLYFSLTHPSAARHVLSRSCHPQYGYSFAIVGINLTHLVYTMLKDGALKNHFYNIAVKELKDLTQNNKGGSAELQLPSLGHLHQVYCFVFLEFDTLWRNQKPSNIMEFNRIRDLLEAQLREKLKSYDVILKCSFVLENV